MNDRLIAGKSVSDAQVQAWADEAEAGYDVDQLRRRWGRPPRGDRAAQVVAIRLTDAELDHLMDRARREGMDRSTAIRAAVREWAEAS